MTALSTWQDELENHIWKPDPNENREEDENAVCKYFGCGVRLTAAEMLYGDYCLKHSGRTKKKMVEVINKYVNK